MWEFGYRRVPVLSEMEGDVNQTQNRISMGVDISNWSLQQCKALLLSLGVAVAAVAVAMAR